MTSCATAARCAAAVETGWNRAKRTILVADGVNFLAALVLFALASSSVRGFAFTLGLTTLIDLLVVFLFTHPVAHAARAASVLPRRPRLVGSRPAPPRCQDDPPVRRPRPLHPPGTCVRRHRRRCGMSFSFATFGNDLYTGKRSIPVVAQRRRFYLVSLAMMIFAVLGLVTQGLNLGLEFRGGSEFRVADHLDPGRLRAGRARRRRRQRGRARRQRHPRRQQHRAGADRAALRHRQPAGARRPGRGLRRAGVGGERHVHRPLVGRVGQRCRRCGRW